VRPFLRVRQWPPGLHGLPTTITMTVAKTRRTAASTNSNKDPSPRRVTSLCQMVAVEVVLVAVQRRRRASPCVSLRINARYGLKVSLVVHGSIAPLAG